MSYSRGYAQTDGRWGKLLLGNNTKTQYDLANYGCLITAWGNMLWWITGDSEYTPAMVNQWLKDNGGFVNGGTMIWGKPLGLGHVTAKGTTSDLNAINQFLAADVNNYAILQVTKPGFPMHFVFAPIADEIVDSEDGVIKPMSTYRVISAHLYTAVTNAPTPVPVSVSVDTVTPPANALNEDTAPMTADQETQAYQIVLNRNPDGSVPSNRTAMQFILDAQTELGQERSTVQQQLADLSGQVSSLQNANADLSSQLSQAQVKLSAVPAVSAPVEAAPTEAPATDLPAYQKGYQELKTPLTLSALFDGTAKDYDGQKPDIHVVSGMVFTQIVGTFPTLDGLMYRTQTSVDRGDWYGTPVALFPATKLTFIESANLGASQAVGLFGRFLNAINPFKKKGLL